MLSHIDPLELVNKQIILYMERQAREDQKFNTIHVIVPEEKRTKQGKH